MKAKELLQLFEVDKFKEEELAGYQRELYEERTSELVEYLSKCPLAIMPAILVMHAYQMVSRIFRTVNGKHRARFLLTARARQDKEGLKEFLRASELCNRDHPFVKATAEEISVEAKTPIKAAISIFYFVRDKIPLSFLDPWKTASETLRIGKGSCLTKANLQVALLRSVGIPARFRIMEFKGNDPNEWEGILPKFAVSRMPERFPHYFAEVHLEGRWIMADATFDKALLPNIEDWNDEKDVCSIEDEVILIDVGAFASIEEEARCMHATKI